jgi:peptidyl-prolyl cis-trans isomerase C
MSQHASCAAKPVITPAKPQLVTVNSVVIPKTAIAREIQNHPASTPVEAWKAAARALAIRELLLQEARRLQIAAIPVSDAEGRRETDDEALINALVAQEVKVPGAGVEECQRYYARNRARFRSPDIFEASHILLAAGPKDIIARDEVRLQAEALIEILKGASASFAALARTHSACPSREVGGNLGQIGPGQTVPEFESALAAMPIGEIYGKPVETRYGFHVVAVSRREPGRQLPFEMVQDRIATYLSERVHRTAVRQYICLLAGRATIGGIELASSPSPLLQ